MPDNKVSFRNAHVRKFKQLSSYIAVKAEILVVFLKNEIKKKFLGHHGHDPGCHGQDTGAQWTLYI